METFNQQIFDSLQLNETFAVATILTHKGSTPRTSGSKMVVLKDRTIHGTVGGGLVEALIIDASIELISKNKCAIKEFTLNQDIKGGLDMVCGGALSVLIETFVPESNLTAKSDLENIFSKTVNLEKEGQKGFHVSKIEGFSKSDFTMKKCLVLPDGNIIGNNMIPKALFDDILDNKFHGDAPVIHNHNLEEYIIEPVLIADCIYIFGAGHVGFQLAKIAHIADFQTVIIDDREEFANPKRFPDARKIHLIKEFDKAFDSLKIDQKSYIVIITRGHLHDQAVLEAALKTDPAYIGMIGSKKKRNTIYTNLLKKDISKHSLENVHSPIGIEIKAQTPSEIAVSILGEIIKKKYSR